MTYLYPNNIATVIVMIKTSEIRYFSKGVTSALVRLVSVISDLLTTGWDPIMF